MFCTKCGVELKEDDRFCSQCGKPIDQPPEPAYIQPRRKLRRIMAQKKIAGVCAGFADYFDMDLTLMRIIWVALLLLPPSIGGIAYVIGWIAMPRDDSPQTSEAA
jgi:phage shock protein C